jgi:small subunit ribosomal protein S23
MMLIYSCVQFTLSLHRHHELPLTQAYTISTKEFVKLRGAHELATQAAEMEARAHGAVFTSDPWVRVPSSPLPCPGL